MKNRIKLIATGLVIFLASHSFAQSASVGSKITSLPVGTATVSKPLTVGTGGAAHLQTIQANYPDVYNKIVNERQGLKTSGMSQKQINQMIENKIKEFRTMKSAQNKATRPALRHHEIARRVNARGGRQ